VRRNRLEVGKETDMNREQAMKHLPALFRKSYLHGSNGSTLTAISVFLSWLYKNGFEIRSFKELKRAEQEKSA
jgi:hypothetical protein